MKYNTISVFDTTTDTYQEESTKKIIIKEMTKSPNNSVIHEIVYERLLDNIELIPLKDLGAFLDSYC